MDWIHIDHYEVTTWAKTDLSNLPFKSRDLARITFYGKLRCIGAAHFFPMGIDAPECNVELIDGDTERPMVSLYYPAEMLMTVLNLLQNESPVWLFFASRSNCGITTGKEPVGEQEGGAGKEQRRQRR